eukprot:scaffold12472_cov115-Cylindrotheca_fusiformis.AAC.8
MVKIVALCPMIDRRWRMMNRKGAVINLKMTYSSCFEVGHRSSHLDQQVSVISDGLHHTMAADHINMQVVLLL